MEPHDRRHRNVHSRLVRLPAFDAGYVPFVDLGIPGPPASPVSCACADSPLLVRRALRCGSLRYQTTATTVKNASKSSTGPRMLTTRSQQQLSSGRSAASTIAAVLAGDGAREERFVVPAETGKIPPTLGSTPVPELLLVAAAEAAVDVLPAHEPCHRCQLAHLQRAVPRRKQRSAGRPTREQSCWPLWQAARLALRPPRTASKHPRSPAGVGAIEEGYAPDITSPVGHADLRQTSHMSLWGVPVRDLRPLDAVEREGLVQLLAGLLTRSGWRRRPSRDGP